MEMTTIRAGVAGGIFLLSLPFMINGLYKKSIVLMAIALFFHTSSVLFFMILILIKQKINIKYYYYALLGSFSIIIAKINILKLLFLDRIFPKIKLYLEFLENNSVDEEVNLFGFRILLATFMAIILGINYNKLKNIKGFEVLYRIHLISLILYFSFSVTAAVFSIRSFELLSVVQILLFPMLVYVFPDKLKYLAWMMLLILYSAQIFIMVDISELYEPYKSWLFSN